jgi:hypothetical protein
MFEAFSCSFANNEMLVLAAAQLIKIVGAFYGACRLIGVFTRTCC